MARRDDLFETTETAWKEFRNALADRIARHDEDDHVLWELDVPERHERLTAPFIQVSWVGPDSIVAEVASNRVLSPQYRADRSALARLRAAGWNAPSGLGCSYWRAVDPAYADEAAWLLVDALRNHFGVVHPSFLVDRYAEDLAAAEAAWLLEDEGEVTEPCACLPEVVSPQNREHLLALVDQALGSDWSRPTPIHDEDDDIPYACGSAMVFVRVLEDAPVIRVFSELVLDVTDSDAAAFEVGVLNRDHAGVKFTVIGDVIRMSADLQALPLVPYHLRVLVTTMCELAERLDSVVARRVKGRTFGQAVGDDAV